MTKLDGTDLRVRDVRPTDTEQVIEIINPIIEAGVHTAFDTPFTVEQERRYIEALPERGIFLVAEEPNDGRLVGFQSMEPCADYTRAFDHVGTMGTYVRLSLRRRGIARALFAATFEQARDKAYEKIFTFIRADNPDALQTYLDQGFTVVGTAKLHAKVRGSYIDEVLIEKLL